MPLGPGHGRSTNGATPYEAENTAILRFRPVEDTGLENLVRSGQSCLGNGTRIFDSVGQRRFAVHVFTRLKGIENDILVFMRSSGHEHRHYVWVVEHFAVVRDPRGLWMGTLRASQHEGEIVTDGCQLQLLDVLDGRCNLASPFSESDHGTGEGITLVRGACRGGKRRGNAFARSKDTSQSSKRSGFEEGTTGEMFRSHSR